MTIDSQPKEDGKPDAELGILLVHGIGQQKRGQTLVDYGDPLCEFIERWVKGSARLQKASEETGLSLNQANSYSDVRTHDAVLTESEDGTPPHVLVELSGPPGQESKRWIVAEAYWADSFPHPHPAPVTRWLIKVSPGIWMNFFARRLSMSVQSIRKTWPGRSRGWAELFSQIVVILFWLLVTVALSPAVLLLEAILISLLIAAVIPLPAIHKFIGQILAKISAVLGDSFIVVSSVVRHQAVLKQVGSALQWLERRS